MAVMNAIVSPREAGAKMARLMELAVHRIAEPRGRREDGRLNNRRA